MDFYLENILNKTPETDCPVPVFKCLKVRTEFFKLFYEEINIACIQKLTLLKL